MKNKIELGAYPMLYPLPLVVVGTENNGIENFAPFGNCGLLIVDPATIYISIEETTCTAQNIKKNGYYSINIPSDNSLAVYDYCGTVSGNQTDKSSLLESFYRKNSNVPMITDCPVNMLCKVVSEKMIENNRMFIAEIVTSYVDEECTTNRYADTALINPVFYTIDNQYWNIGKHLGSAFSLVDSIK